MRISTFKQLTSHLPDTTPIKCTCMAREYALAHDDFYNPSYRGSGCLDFGRGNNRELTLKELYDWGEKEQDPILQLDIEDGFVYSDVSELVLHKGMVVLFD